jgi:hypothetical protein
VRIINLNNIESNESEYAFVTNISAQLLTPGTSQKVLQKYHLMAE